MLDERLLVRINNACGDVNPEYIETILKQDDDFFGNWFAGRLQGIGEQPARELAKFLAHPIRTDCRAVNLE